MALSTLNPPLPAVEDLTAPTPRPPQPTPKTPTKKKLGPRLSRDIRRDILLLRELNDNDDEIECTYERIVTLLSYRYGRKVTLRAVQYTVNLHKATPQKERRGRKPILITSQVDEIEAYVLHSRIGRQATQKRGYSRRVALRKPPNPGRHRKTCVTESRRRINT
jgi:hypothetical protein